MLAAIDRPFPSAVEPVLARYGPLIDARHASPREGRAWIAR